MKFVTALALLSTASARPQVGGTPQTVSVDHVDIIHIKEIFTNSHNRREGQVHTRQFVHQNHSQLIDEDAKIFCTSTTILPPAYPTIPFMNQLTAQDSRFQLLFGEMVDAILMAPALEHSLVRLRLME
jgi:hypothetical protein